MSPRTVALVLAGVVLGGAAVFFVLERFVLATSPVLAAEPELIAALEQAQADLKQLASVDSGKGDTYRTRFEEVSTLVKRLRILEHNRETIARRQEIILLLLVVATLLVTGAVIATQRGRETKRLATVGQALARLARGETGIALDERRRDTIGRIAAMIEETSRQVARDRQRLESLRNLRSWQEAARRQAHELRAPLTAARLELDRLAAVLAPDGAAEDGANALRAELDRLRIAIGQFATFARVPEPQLRSENLAEVAREFATTFASAWPAVHLVAVEPSPACPALVDRSMIRQVLQNLCDNAARAIGTHGGTITLSACSEIADGWVALDVADDGPGIAPEVRDRLFEPYVTTCTPGEGMGLGLAISRKIMLDHGGDLELVSALPAVFRLLVPKEA